MDNEINDIKTQPPISAIPKKKIKPKSKIKVKPKPVGMITCQCMQDWHDGPNSRYHKAGEVIRIPEDQPIPKFYQKAV